MGHTVEGLPSIAFPASPGESASPSGENTVARTGFTTLPALAAEPLGCEDDDGAFRPSWSPPGPPPTSPKSQLNTEPSTTNAKKLIAPQTPSPNSSRFRRPSQVYASGGVPGRRDA